MANLRRYLAAGFLLFMFVLWGGASWLSDGFLAKACSAIFAAGDLIAAIALLRRWFWGRWFGLGIGLVGSLNTVAWLGLGNWSTDPMLVIQGVGFALLFVMLLGDGMRAQFELRRSASNHWDFTRPGMQLLSWAVVLNIATAPELLAYGCMSATGLGVAARAVAIASAAALAIAVVLVVMCRAAGVLLMTAAGVATVVLGILGLPVLTASHDPSQVLVTLTALTAFPPGILGALASAVVFARPIVRFLRAE